MSKLLVSPSPHVKSGNTTTKVMLDVIIALLPVVVASVFIFGFRRLLVIAVAIASSVLSEYFFELICKRKSTIKDLSAVVTGLILALNLPSTMPLWEVALGSIFAIVVVKMLFGGIGKNFANPALTGRIFLFISFSSAMSNFTSKYDIISSATKVDTLTGATPLEMPKEFLPSLTDMFLGKYNGCIGETCKLALLIGLVYLLVKKVITWHTPITFIGTVFVFSWILSLCGMDIDPVYQILSGGLFLGAIFMATDYVTSPQTAWGKVIFGIGAGIITVVIRQFASYPEGISFSILLMNILTPYINDWTRKMPFGGKKQ
ncbi:MAG: RnfABCDGE type electron transport complex subunit D [Clostridia bacterium]|nr:RnfABCDGE type electron transport complex subunit D [Clostridia bacterium]